MAKSLNLKVIAEGVEDEAQMSFLRAHQCDEIQGYYFSKPVAVDKVAEKLRGEVVQALENYPPTHNVSEYVAGTLDDVDPAVGVRSSRDLPLAQGSGLSRRPERNRL